MSLHYFIDGYNVIRSDARLDAGSFDARRERLLAWIEERNLCGSPRNAVTVVFDGKPGPGWTPWRGRARVVFTYEEDADTVIKRSVDESSRPRDAVVVTDDRAIQRWVGGAKARVVGCADFLRGARAAGALRRGKVDAGEAAEINEELKRVWKLK